MHLSFYGKKYDIPDQLKAYAEQKLSVLEKLVPDLQDVRLNITRDQHHTKGEVFSVNALSRGSREHLNAHVIAEDPYTGVDMLMSKLENQLEHEQGKRRSVRRRFKRILSPRNMYATSRRGLTRFGGGSRRIFGRVFRRRGREDEEQNT
ncbi:MAG: ribosome-associated translation inhibitor RaiA [Patescibacteria group bacterium]|jgi:ribosomal subunit interface protein